MKSQGSYYYQPTWEQRCRHYAFS